MPTPIHLRRLPQYVAAQKERNKKHYLANREVYLERARASNARHRAWVDSLKQGKKCVQCGESRTVCLDFHHIDPKTKTDTIANMRIKTRSKEAILAEIKLCIVLCANCHRVEHANAELRGAD